MKLNYSKIVGYTCWISYGGLGFYRGLQSYKYNYQKDLKNYNEYGNTPFRKPYYYTSDSILLGLGVFCLYMAGPLFPVTIVKEIKRIEIKLRGYEEEMNSDAYYDIMF